MTERNCANHVQSRKVKKVIKCNLSAPVCYSAYNSPVFLEPHVLVCYIPKLHQCLYFFCKSFLGTRSLTKPRYYHEGKATYSSVGDSKRLLGDFCRLATGYAPE